MSDIDLMKKILAQWGPRLAKLPADLQPFVAALIANESNGNPNAKRFEPGVYKKLKSQYPDWPEDKLGDNATSWGLTQIMGYHVEGEPSQLCDPDFALNMTETMLRGFQKQFKLDPTDSESLFRCWNTGNPRGKTFDPEYVTNGLARMVGWRQIEDTQA